MQQYNLFNVNNKNKNVLVTGATGLVGKEIVLHLILRGYTVTVISRSPQPKDWVLPVQWITGDLNQGKVDAISGVSFYAVINLMGESVGQRWTDSAKEKILNSRERATKNLIESLQVGAIFISTSAIGYYGDAENTELNETLAPVKSDFLSEVCQKWESPVRQSEKHFKRSVILRVGLVISEKGGALSRMLPIFKFGLGGNLGSGEQWMSWIHLDDLVRMYLFVLENEIESGVFNAVAPTPVRNQEWTDLLVKNLKVIKNLPAPEIVLGTIMGEMKTLLFGSQKVSAQKILSKGFSFQYVDLNSAFQSAFKHLIQGETKLRFFQVIKGSQEQVFKFFSDEKNLEKLTPDLLRFKVLRKTTEQIQEGTHIFYNLKIHGFPVKWETVIENWNPPFEFVDSQLRGPYKKWHHTHSFYPVSGGILMIDTVVYQEPFGIIGRLGAGWMVSKDVHQIFEYRRKVLAEVKFS